MGIDFKPTKFYSENEFPHYDQNFIPCSFAHVHLGPAQTVFRLILLEWPFSFFYFLWFRRRHKASTQARIVKLVVGGVTSSKNRTPSY